MTLVLLTWDGAGAAGAGVRGGCGGGRGRGRGGVETNGGLGCHQADWNCAGRYACTDDPVKLA